MQRCPKHSSYIFIHVWNLILTDFFSPGILITVEIGVRPIPKANTVCTPQPLKLWLELTPHFYLSGWRPAACAFWWRGTSRGHVGLWETLHILQKEQCPCYMISSPAWCVRRMMIINAYLLEFEVMIFRTKLIVWTESGLPYVIFV